MGSIERELKAIRAALKSWSGEQQTVPLEEAARRMRLTRKQITALLHAGLLRSTVVNRKRVIPISELRR